MVFIADNIISMLVASNDGNSSGVSSDVIVTTELSTVVNSALRLLLFVLLSLEEEMISASFGPYDLAIGSGCGVDGW